MRIQHFSPNTCYNSNKKDLASLPLYIKNLRYPKRVSEILVQARGLSIFAFGKSAALRRPFQAAWAAH